MGFLLKRRKGKAATSKKSSSEGVNRTLYQRIQFGWASWMQRHTARMAPKKWRFILFLFIMLAGGYSVFLAVRSLLGKGATILLVTPIQKPGILKQGKAAMEKGAITEPEYRRIRQFRQYMDSLMGNAEGKKVYDSILYYRPGLMDSVRFIENFYQQQSK